MEFGLSWDMALFVFGAVAAGLTIGVAGFGAGPVALAVWLHVLEPAVAAPVLALCVGAAQVQSFMVVRRAFEWQRVWPLVLGGVVGVPVGAGVLLYVAPDVLSSIIGAFLVVYASVFLLIRRSAGLAGGGLPAEVAAGFTAGFVGGAAGIPGPIMNIWCGLRGWASDVQRATFQPFNMAAVAVAVVVYFWHGLVTSQVWWLVAVGLPAIAIGARIGVTVYHRFNEAQYRRLVLIVLLVSGLVLTVRW